MADKGQQGTGKHPHKSAAEPYPHNDAQKGREGGKSSLHQGNGSKAAASHKGDGDMKAREHKGKDGETHHHARTKGGE